VRLVPWIQWHVSIAYPNRRALSGIKSQIPA
jgi:hypothetical protein